MSDSPLLRRPNGSDSRSIPSTSSNDADASTATSSPSSFKSLGPSRMSRKKPQGLSIEKSMRPAALVDATSPSNRPREGLKGLSGWTSEADRLRQDIERLHLSSKTSTGSESPPLSPVTPTTLGASDSSSASGGLRKKEKVSSGEKKKKKDKNGEDLVKDEDLEVLGDLGAGNGGTVTRVWNKKRNTVMARKVCP